MTETETINFTKEYIDDNITIDNIMLDESFTAEKYYKTGLICYKEKKYDEMKNNLEISIILGGKYANRSLNTLGDYYRITKDYKKMKNYYIKGAVDGDKYSFIALIKYYKEIEFNIKSLEKICISAIIKNYRFGLKELCKIIRNDVLYAKLELYYNNNQNEGIFNALNELKNIPIVIYYIENHKKNINNIKNCERCKKINVINLQFPCGHEECLFCYLNYKYCREYCGNYFYIFDI